MPELAEVEHARRLWDVARGEPLRDVLTASAAARVLRDVDFDALQRALANHALLDSEARGKQMVFRFGAGPSCWLGVHLGMTGRLRVEPPTYEPVRHDHLVLRTASRALVFTDPRGFGRVRFALGAEEPAWWASMAPSVLGEAFTAAAVGAFLARHPRVTLKAALLMQARFPGVGNWMADEILWRAGLHPATRAGALDGEAVAELWRVVRRVARLAVDTIGDDWGFPSTWLFTHRWAAGGSCPRCDAALARDTIGGRTTCWCPRCQPARRSRNHRVVAG
jgi:formamidopyrimidine-DNA glycosylase